MIMIMIITGRFQVTKSVSEKVEPYVRNPIFNMHSLRTVLLRCLYYYMRNYCNLIGLEQ